jgi:hypothetical protein
MHPSLSTTGCTDGIFHFPLAHQTPRLGLNEVLDKAAFHAGEPKPLAVYESSLTGTKPIFASAVAAYNASKVMVGIWVSEPMFGTAHVALDHAEDMLGCELFPIISL